MAEHVCMKQHETQKLKVSKQIKNQIRDDELPITAITRQQLDLCYYVFG